MTASLKMRLTAAASERASQSLVRHRRATVITGTGAGVRRDEKALINFSANDYLGLARDPRLAAAMAEGAHRYGTGAAASPLVTGHSPIHAELESALADFTGFEAVALLPSGYQANLAVGQALVGRGSHVLADRLNHASLNDGLRLSGARLTRYRHADADHAAERIMPKTELIVTDGVFSMDGDVAPLHELTSLAAETDTAVWLDDAHGFGVLGDDGRGSLEAMGLSPDKIDVFVATFGKALGTSGAFIAGDRAMIEHLENTARPLIYSTALSPALVAATLKALELIRTESWRREKLHTTIDLFQGLASRAGLDVVDSRTPIQIMKVGDNHRALAWSEQLAEAGFLVSAIRPPTVPAGSARLRIALSTSHTAREIEGLIECLSGLGGGY
ncbi:MAG: 8-amino-7-oxononanoate synthase [Wenzhouxiangella sp.]